MRADYAKFTQLSGGFLELTQQTGNAGVLAGWTGVVSTPCGGGTSPDQPPGTAAFR